jgi:alanine-glyoxylate transaminase/serine-glyoxylate transaminase/serine-pyruvate transaminase
MSFNAVSDKAIAASKSSKMTKAFWGWDEMITMNKIGLFPYTPATNTLQGLVVAIDMLHEEGLDNVFARHDRLAEATRRAVRAWGLEIMCRDPKDYSPTVTAVLTLGALAATEMALSLAGIPHRKGGVQAAIDYLVTVHASPARAAAE